jgi:hypothetical protein
MAFAFTETLAAFVRSSGISNVELKDEDVQQVIDTLIYDGKVDKVKDAALSISVRPFFFSSFLFFSFLFFCS